MKLALGVQFLSSAIPNADGTAGIAGRDVVAGGGETSDGCVRCVAGVLDRFRRIVYGADEDGFSRLVAVSSWECWLAQAADSVDDALALRIDGELCWRCSDAGGLGSVDGD